MPFEPWPDEPDELDPESRWGDPERDLPRVPSAPKPTTREADVDPDVLETFWLSVLLANVAVFGLSLGPMLIFFRGMWLWGGASMALGAVCLLRVYQHYRAFEARRADDEDGDAVGAGDADVPSDAAPPPDDDADGPTEPAGDPAHERNA